MEVKWRSELKTSDETAGALHDNIAGAGIARAPVTMFIMMTPRMRKNAREKIIKWYHTTPSS